VNYRKRRRRLMRRAAVTLSVFAVSTWSFAWSIDRFTRSLGVHYGGQTVVLGAVWMTDAGFTAAMAWDVGRALFSQPQRLQTLPVRAVDPRPPALPRSLNAGQEMASCVCPGAARTL